MHRVLVWSLSLFLLPLAVSACGQSSHESLTDEMVTSTEEIADVLETVTDKASAEAAKPRLEAIAKKMKDTLERRKALGEPDAAEQQAIAEKVKSRLDASQARMMQAMMRLQSQPDALQVLRDTITGIGPLE